MNTRAQPHHFDGEMNPEKVSNLEETLNILFTDLQIVAGGTGGPSGAAGPAGMTGAIGAAGVDGAQPAELLALLRYAYARIDFLERVLSITYGPNDILVPDEISLLN